MQIGIVLYHQLDVCPLVSQHGPKTKKAMEQATLIAMDRGAHVVPTGHKGHVRAKKKGNWVHKNNRIREEELEEHEVEQQGLKKKKKKKRDREEVCEDQEVGQEVSRKKKTTRPKGGNELAEDYASPVSTKSQFRTEPAATPMTSPEDSSMSSAGSPNEERRKVSIEEQQTERCQWRGQVRRRYRTVRLGRWAPHTNFRILYSKITHETNKQWVSYGTMQSESTRTTPSEKILDKRSPEIWSQAWSILDSDFQNIDPRKI